MYKKRLGQKLRQKRKEKGYTSQELADLCFINHGYVRQLESGQKVPSTPLLLSLCDVLDTSPNYLLEYTEDSVDKEILNNIYKLTPQQKRVLLYMISAYLNYNPDQTGD